MEKKSSYRNKEDDREIRVVEICRTTSYNKHGCNITGNLAVIEYWDELKRVRKFGFDEYDVYEVQLEYISSIYPNYDVLLGIPALVVDIHYE